MLNQIFELNPQAFINGDINKLRQGVVLTLPSTDSKTAPTVVDSVTVVAGNPSPAASSIVASTREELTLSIEDPTSIIEAESTLIEDGRFAENSDFEIEKSGAGDLLDTGISTANNAGKVALALTATDSLDWRAENPELSKKLDSLGDKYAALRARFAEQSIEQSAADGNDESLALTEPLVIATSEASIELAEISSPMPTTSAAPSNGALEEENLVAGPSGELSPGVSASSENLASNSRFELPTWLLALLGLTLLVSAVGYVLYRLSAASRRQAEQVTRTAKDDSLKQELAKKAQHRIMMEGEVERMLGERLEDDGDEIEKTMQLHIDDVLPEQLDSQEIDITPAPDDSAQGRIDASISHGRYAEAEDLLREVIVDSPRNFTAKLRLAEVYYITEKISDFVEISQDIHAHHRPDISDEDWRRVMRMGKMIAPEQPPFSGPQSILGDASAG